MNIRIGNEHPDSLLTYPDAWLGAHASVCPIKRCVSCYDLGVRVINE